MRMTLDKTWSGSVLTIVFQNRDADGKVTGPAAEPVVFDISTVAESQHLNAEQHGWEQRLGDGAAISKDTKTGKSATPADKRARVQGLADYYLGGAETWNMKGGGPVNADALLAKLAALGYDVSRVSKPPVDVTPQE